MKLGLVLPTNSPTKFFSMFASELSLDALTRGFTDEIIVGSALQPPWNADQIASATDRLGRFGIDFRWGMVDAVASPYPGVWLSETSASLLKDCEALMIVDDDMIFTLGTERFRRTAGEEYAASMQYLASNPSCGSIQHCGNLGGNWWGFDIRPTKNGLVATERGLMFRRAPWSDGWIWHKTALHNLGPMRETVLVYGLVERGWYHARTFNAPIKHKAGRLGDDEHVHSVEAAYSSIGNGGWVRKRYNEPQWVHHVEKMDTGMRTIGFPDQLKLMHRLAASARGWERRL